jgi:ABC-type oligopeptide transport system substrate-binding subunit
MKKFAVFFLILILSGLMLAACQRDRGVYAGNESDTYQPRPAPKPEKINPSTDIKGELVRVDTPSNMIVVRLDNGMVQTFKFDEKTTVTGVEIHPQTNPSKAAKISNNAVRSLIGLEASEVTVLWSDDGGTKTATKIEVTQISTSKNIRRGRR